MNNINEINTLQYLGSKSRILRNICEPILSHRGIDTVVDLFAGTGSVGYALKDNYKVISNDVEFYAYTLNKAILKGCSFTKQEEDVFWDKVDALLQEISKAVKHLLEEESAYFVEEVDYVQYKEFCENTPSVFCPTSGYARYNELERLVNQIKPGGGQFQEVDFPCLFLTYYANAYFGIAQCCQIDAICGVIHSLNDSQQKDVLLTALMSTMSLTASTTTHFAQYLKAKNKSTCKNLIEKRRFNIIDGMRQKLVTYRTDELLDQKFSKAECYNLDYIDCLQQIHLDSSTLIYADPPYFKEHYSRYYHVLNTLCLYDYPDMAINSQTHKYTVGRYRVDRNISEFGKRATALTAFEKLINYCADQKAWLILSYSDNSIVKIEDIQRVAGNRYNVQVNKVELNHSNQGRTSNSKVDEYLFLCCPSVCDDDITKKLDEIKKVTPIVDNPAGLMHNYMARKPFNVVSAIINQFCPPDGTVFDPMFGSGTTLIEASKLGRSAIGTDLNVLAYKLCKASLTKWDVDSISKLLDLFTEKVQAECAYLYQYNVEGENQIIERCHFDQKDGKLLPTAYWYKKIINGKWSGRKKEIADEDFIESYNDLRCSTILNIVDKPLIPNSRIAIKDNDTVYKYFCNRNLKALDIILDILKSYQGNPGYAVLELLISSAINLIKLSDKKASSQMPYWLPKTNVTSRNAIMVIEKKVAAFKDGLIYLNECCQLHDGIEGQDEKLLTIRNEAAQDISKKDLPDGSVDLILTDPPYTDQVPYIEYSQIIYNILNWDALTEDILNSELVVSDAPSRKKDTDDFNTVFSLIVERASKALRDGGYFVMFYHTFDLKSWSKILTLMQTYGLQYRHQIPSATPRKSFKTIMSPNSTLDGNYIIVFQKTDTGNCACFEGTLLDAKNKAIDCANRIISDGQSITTQDLYDCGMLKCAFEDGYLGILADAFSSFAEVIKDEFNYTDGIWREK
ncbi:MAG: DNA adenine methylase [Eubacteriales bacterium]|nr:DNA adenine methylase [Eubacteriales bacterium]